ncbi:hypothetical protein [Streptomyces sp. 11x1]|nr:hypothetical protein [Streptomyces sp. 11x1]WNZ11178.1 hypothetical protein P8T65_28930 [Streptomyces sp. 11x1]
MQAARLVQTHVVARVLDDGEVVRVPGERPLGILAARGPRGARRVAAQ